jgi:hypothetical protein
MVLGMAGGRSMMSVVFVTPARAGTAVVTTVAATVVTIMEGGKGNLGLTISIQIGQRIGGGTGGILISRVMMMRMMMGLLGSKGSAEAVVRSTRLLVACLGWLGRGQHRRWRQWGSRSWRILGQRLVLTAMPSRKLMLRKRWRMKMRQTKCRRIVWCLIQT